MSGVRIDISSSNIADGCRLPKQTRTHTSVYLVGDELDGLLACDATHHAGNIVKLHCSSTHNLASVRCGEQRCKRVVQHVLGGARKECACDSH